MSNTTAIQYHAWKPEPLTRGTFSILSTCLTTMTFCVWTAVHLNIPEYKKESEQFWRKIKWMFIALIAPEYVALCAFWQRRTADKIGDEARRAFSQPEPLGWQQRCRLFLDKILGAPVELWLILRKTLRKLFASVRSLTQKNDEESSSTRDSLHDGVETIPGAPYGYPWTTTHSMYAAMGGFALDTHGEPDNYLPRKRRRILLTDEGVIFLLRHEPSLITGISEAAIKDKSKANWLIKAFVCVQAVWFCAQCFSRWQQHLSVSLLEINTLAHALCALLIYALWWAKPLDVEEPTLIRGEQSYGICAYMCLCSWGNKAIHSFSKEFHNPEIRLKYVTNACDLVKSTFTSQVIRERGLDGDVPSKTPNNDGTIDLQRGECARGFQLIDESFSVSSRILKLQSVDVTCLKRAGRALNARPELLEPEECERESSSSFFAIDASLVADRMVNDFRTGEFYKTGLSGFTYILSSLFYGGIHLIAWNDLFRTGIESLLWKVSGLTIIALGLTFPWSILLIPGKTLIAICRVYIIVESFVDVFHLPESAFQVPQWSQYFWHAG